MAHAIHPGLLIRGALPALKAQGVTLSGLADQLGMSRQNLDQLLKCRRALTPPTALRVARVITGRISAEDWMRVQIRYDLAQAEAELADELEQLQVLVDAEAPIGAEPQPMAVAA